MNARTFFEKVALMRQKQAEYYKSRDKTVLRQSIALEQEIDKEIERVRSLGYQQTALGGQPQHFIDMQYGNGTPSSIEQPSCTITTNPKHNLVTCHYLMNPQFTSTGSSLDKPCFTLIARMDKRPPYLVEATVPGDSVAGCQYAIEVYDTDSPMTAKIKEFMALYGIVDIKMRMLKVAELKKIMGFPEDYVLVGTQAEQKKFIGNAVEVGMARVLCQALSSTLARRDASKLKRIV